MTTAVKKTFAELQAETEASRHNSNLQNLASAFVRITEDLERLDAERARLVALQNEIAAAGDNPAALTLARTKELYAAVHYRE